MLPRRELGHGVGEALQQVEGREEPVINQHGFSDDFLKEGKNLLLNLTKTSADRRK